MKIIATSDLHGELPPIEPCDMLLIAGDICPDVSVIKQAKWLDTSFRKWLEQIKCKEIIGIAGNHDFVFQDCPHLIPTLPWIYLEDQLLSWGEGDRTIKIYGSPWQRNYGGWAFMGTEEELKVKFDRIPNNVDILITHSPPYGFRDKITENITEKGYDEVHLGSTSLWERMKELYKTRSILHVFGHIHSGYGVIEYGKSILINASLLDESYIATNEPVVFEI